ncbi:hypothetical protein B0A55_03265 [Friedmanniomyces simplex]|uniref:DRBM domain-containing protein n=1 Tax=Friedmanniomyces simplex TaxID=329884 RepID=A0A4U0XND2_9PEZI|nr:hypothetical protein B0A55_03265 [Friedmanniomyces simplex]
MAGDGFEAPDAHRFQAMPISPPQSGKAFEIEGFARPGNHVNVEDHIKEESHDLELQDIDDWERENPRQEKGKFVPMQTVKVSQGYNPGLHMAVANQDAKYNPEYIAKLHSLCWERGLTAAFDFTETTPRIFAASVSFAGETVKSEGSFPAKKLAKENVCKLAIPIVERFDPNSKKCKSSEDGMDVDKITEEELNSANWAGTLQNFTQAHKLPMPDYTELRTPYVPHLFSCTVRLANKPDTIFGSDTTLYSTKQAAKKAAAREAVLWIRSQGFIFKEAKVTGGPSTPSMKRQKAHAAAASAPESGSTGLSQGLQEVDMNKLAHLSLPQQVHETVVLMGFSQPEMRAQPSGDGAFGASYVDMAAHFSTLDIQKDPRLAGPIGKVERVFGKKQAKEQCCREVLSFLAELKSGSSG